MFQQVGRVRSLQIIVTQVIGIDFHVVLLQAATKSGKVGQPVHIYNQTVQGIAHADTACLGVADNGGSFRHITLLVKINVTHTGSCLDNGNRGVLPHIVYQPLAAAGDNQIHIAAGMEQRVGRIMSCRQQCHQIRRQVGYIQQGIPDNLHQDTVGEIGIASPF